MRNLFLIALLVFLILFLSSGHDLFHNHEPDLKHHHDCPAHQLYLLFQSIFIFVFIFLFLRFKFVCSIIIECGYVQKYGNYNYYSRAPPFEKLKTLT